MTSRSPYDIAKKYLYEDSDKIPELYRERVQRVRLGFTQWYEYPSKSRREIKDLIVGEFGVSMQKAYEDISIIEQLMGNIKNPSKAWIRYRVNTMLEEALALAKKRDDPKAMALIADKMGKYNMLDKDDPERVPFDQIVPQPFEPTEDPSVLGITRDPNFREKKRKLLEKYSAEIDIEDVAFTTIEEPTDVEDTE